MWYDETLTVTAAGDIEKDPKLHTPVALQFSQVQCLCSFWAKCDFYLCESEYMYFNDPTQYAFYINSVKGNALEIIIIIINNKLFSDSGGKQQHLQL